MGFYEYLWTDGVTKSLVRLTSSVATAGGFVGRNPNQAYRKWTGGSKNLRHLIIFHDSTRHEDRIPVASPQDNRTMIGGTVDGIAGRDGWRITGYKGENVTFD
jgi:hypothetical protein